MAPTKAMEVKETILDELMLAGLELGVDIVGSNGLVMEEKREK